MTDRELFEFARERVRLIAQALAECVSPEASCDLLIRVGIENLLMTGGAERTARTLRQMADDLDARTEPRVH